MHNIKISTQQHVARGGVKTNEKKRDRVGRRKMALLVVEGVRICKSFFWDVIVALPAQWLCAPGGWADPPQRPAQGAESTGVLCLQRVGAGWPPSGVYRNPGGGREDSGGQG